MTARKHRNALQPGYQLHWYEIKSILGQGGFGITYLAHDTNLDRAVAIKEYLPTEFAVRDGDHSVHPASADAQEQYEWGLDRFIQEARTLSRFEHPNIVRVYAVFEENHTGYMVMPYEKGHSLQTILSKKRTLNEATLKSVIEPLLDGLNLIHREGFIHRDIKPDNIFIREDGSPVLLDFGSARQAVAGKTKTLTTLVSPGYAPFEQYYSRSDEQGPWTDIYGLGATLYRGITGKPPMDAVDRSKSMLDGSRDDFVPASDIGKGEYSDSFLKAVDHAICFRLKERPQTVKEWQREFAEQADEGETQLATNFDLPETQEEKPTVGVQEKHWGQSGPWIAMLLTLLIVVVSAFYMLTSEESAGSAGKAESTVPAVESVESEQTEEKPADEVEKQPAEQQESEAQLTQQQTDAEQQAQQLEEEAEHRAEEQQRQAAEQQAEEQRLQAERELEQQRLQLEQERQRFEQEQRQALARQAELEKQQQLEAARKAEVKRQAELEKQRQLEQQRLAEEQAEGERLQRLEAERQLALQQEEQRRLEEQRLLAEEQQRAEEERLRQEAIERKIARSQQELASRLASAPDNMAFQDAESPVLLSTLASRQAIVKVSAVIEKWQNSGIKLVRGETYSLQAQGKWQLGPVCKPTGPGGEDMYTIACWDLGGQIVAGRSHSALIAKVGQESLGFYLGAGIHFTADQDGVLYMMSNDAPGFFFDNSGQLEVTIRLED